jgi:hypothetical protein
MALDGPEVAVQGIDDEQAGLGSLEGVFEHGSVTEAESRRLGGSGVEDSAEQGQARGVAVEAGEAGMDEAWGFVVSGGIEDGAGFAGGVAGWGGGDSSPAECGSDREGDIGFARAGIARKHG